MYDRARLLELIESAQDAHPYCPACGATSDVGDEDGALVLRCSAAAAPTGLLARIGAAMLPHLRITLVDAEELLAA
jgi:hypothetical protein